MAATPSLEEKTAFFAQLEALDGISSDEDKGSLENDKPRSLANAFFARPEKPLKSYINSAQLELSSREPAPLHRTTSAPLTTISSTQPDITITSQTARRGVTMPRRNNTGPPSLGRSASDAPASASATKSTSRKRKSMESSDMVPEAKRIFVGSRFYYIPDNIVNPIRKLCINKGKQYGAEWTKDLKAATHVIVDLDLKWDDIKDIIGQTPSVAPIVVNETYPLDCIQYNQILNHTQSRYRVQGYHINTSALQTELPEPLSSAASLQIKPAARTDPGLTQESALSVRRDSSPVIVPSSINMAEVAREMAAADKAASSEMVPASEDALSEAIQDMQQFKGREFLDDDDDEPTMGETGNSDEDEDSERSDGERQRKRRAVFKVSNPSGKNGTWEDKFACNQGGSKDKASQEANPNAPTAKILQEMCDIHTNTSEHWRMSGYRKAIKALLRQDILISTAEEALKIPSIGPRIAKKIEEIVSTGNLEQLEYANSDPLNQLLATFLKIYGVGTIQARKWIAMKFKSLEDLKESAHLTKGQRIGIDHYDDLNTRIPRQEVEALGEHVRKTAAKIDADVEFIIGGSYRRGSDSSGDIDFIVTKKGTSSPDDLLPFAAELVRVLEAEGFLTAELSGFRSSLSDSQDGSASGSGSKWHGCCVLPEAAWTAIHGNGETYRPVWRRIDFLLVPETQYGAALIYFTGDDIFNRSMRLLASKKGLRLNQRGLYKDVLRGKGGVKMTEGELIEGQDERRIFDALGVKWREPTERWCGGS